MTRQTSSGRQTALRQMRPEVLERLVKDQREEIKHLKQTIQVLRTHIHRQNKRIARLEAAIDKQGESTTQD